MTALMVDQSLTGFEANAAEAAVVDHGLFAGLVGGGLGSALRKRGMMPSSQRNSRPVGEPDQLEEGGAR
mgnify:CR=1 FL=1